MTADREELPWELFGSAADELAAGVAADGFAPDLILAIARGGLFVAGALGYALGVKNVAVINVEFYTGVATRLDVPVMLPPFLDVHDLDDANVLVGHVEALLQQRTHERDVVDAALQRANVGALVLVDADQDGPDPADGFSGAQAGLLSHLAATRSKGAAALSRG